MAIQVVPYTEQWHTQVARFNERMRAGNAPAAFGIAERAVEPGGEPVHTRQLLAVDEAEVRGGVIILEHPARLNDSSAVDGSIGRETVINLQSPLSEGIIDPRYAMVSIQLIRHALKYCQYAYVVGMGSEQNPLPRLLKASGWKVRPVPFFFRILRTVRSLTQLVPLQGSPGRKALAVLGAYSGGAALALRFAQRQRPSAAGYRIEKAGRGGLPTDDGVWSTVERRLSFGVVRDSNTVGCYLPPEVERYRVYRGDELCGWFSVLISPMQDHSYFGNLTVATLVDMVAMEPVQLAAFATLAVTVVRAADCDLVVSNQLQTEAQAALHAAGFLGYRSNYLLATSRALSSVMNDETSMVTRQDGDGLVNLHASR